MPEEKDRVGETASGRLENWAPLRGKLYQLSVKRGTLYIIPAPLGDKTPKCPCCTHWLHQFLLLTWGDFQRTGQPLLLALVNPTMTQHDRGYVSAIIT